MILEQHQGGMLECLGQGWTWVSVESSVVPLTDLVGAWSDVITIYSDSDQINIRSNSDVL
jgi:hypothetical protein